jgi:hypothetical protein
VTIGPNRGGIRHLSIGKNLNILDVLTASNGKKNSASNEPIFNRSISDFHGPLGQKLVFGAPKEYFRNPLFSNQFLKIR